MIKKIAIAMVAAGGLMVAAAPAHAGGHVSLSLGVGLPIGGYAYAPPPVYYGPPAAVYSAPAVVYEPAPYYGDYYGPRYYGRPSYERRYYGPRVAYRPARPYYGHGGWHDHDDRHDRGEWHR